MQSDAARNSGERTRGETPVPATGRTVRKGQLVRSARGRDTGRWYLVVDRGQDGFIYVADGVQRPVSRPKRKNPKHLLVWSTLADGIAEAFATGHRITDAEVRDTLLHITNSPEFNGEEVDDTE